jgi:hypothetical protein
MAKITITEMGIFAKDELLSNLAVNEVKVSIMPAHIVARRMRNMSWLVLCLNIPE